MRDRILVVVGAGLASMLTFAGGCSGPAVSSNPVLIDPTATSKHSGGTDDIYEATQLAIQSLMTSPKVREQKGNRVVLDQIVNMTGIPGYDENVIYNRFLASLMNSAGDKLIFLDRESVAKERQLQQSGQVKTSGIDPAMTGADMVLKVELRQIPSAKTKTIQYTFRLTDLTGVIVWTDSFEVKKYT
ncbi:MAG TPA: hypothetical protein VFD71_17410 [Planctomycetota bacterium]|jgi:PBP1b-binding outer membrane lipoprotein LpoB|nr:hypothetical protein [Planctomycetota bacterium]